MNQRTVTPEQITELWIIAGRRAGKSLIAALIAVYLACFFDYSKVLAPGEVGTLMIIAADRKQARVVLRYVRAFLKNVPSLKKMIVRETKESVELSNNVVIEVHTASFSTTRGYTIVAAILDEIAFFATGDAAQPDEEILNALRPGMATVPGSLLICISSPYAKRGALYEAHSRYFGKNDPHILVWQAESRAMNPTLSQSVVNAAYEKDAASASAEYGGQFRSDIESFITREMVNDAIIKNRVLLPFVSAFSYVGFADAAGGSGKDSFTIAVAHKDANEKTILDCLMERKPPFSPEQTIKEFSEVFKNYHVAQIKSDPYAAEFPVEQFRKCGIDCKRSEFSKSEIYLEFLPLLSSGKVELLDNPKLLAQLCNLERRTGRSGKDSVDHGPGQHDDLINAGAGAVVLAATRPRREPGFYGMLLADEGGDETEEVTESLTETPQIISIDSKGIF